MISYPEYDLATLPALTIPYEDKQEVTKKYLGNRASTGQEYLNFDIFMVDNTERKALYDFWKDDCNYGAEPFLAPLPLFGEVYVKTMPNVVVQFIDEVSVAKQDIHWSTTISVKVIGTVDYVYDDALAYITDDSGAFIYADSTSNSNKEITYA